MVHHKEPPQELFQAAPEHDFPEEWQAACLVLKKRFQSQSRMVIAGSRKPHAPLKTILQLPYNLQEEVHNQCPDMFFEIL